MTFEAPKDFDLGDSVRFLVGFTPQQVAPDADEPTRLRFATPLPPGWMPTEVTVRQRGNVLSVDWDSDLDEADIREHVERILSLDVDASRFAEVVDADDVIREIVDPERGIRPPLFWSPYEAAVWAVLSQRVQMTRASKLKQRLATEAGTTSASGRLVSTPAPELLAQLQHVAWLDDTKIKRLQAVARAANDGVLDPVHLRTMDTSDALAGLQTIDGIGPFSAELILVRGAGAPDIFPINERRVHAIIQDLYDRSATSDEIAELADRWSPYRSWIAFHLRRHAAR